MPGEWLYFLLALTNYWWRNLCDTNQKWRAFAFKASCALLLQPTCFKKCNVYFERKSSSFTFSLKSSQIHFDLATSLQVFASICKLVGIFHANYWRPEHSAIDRRSFQCSTAYLFDTNLVLASKLQQPLANLLWNTNLSIATGWLQPLATSLGILIFPWVCRPVSRLLWLRTNLHQNPHWMRVRISLRFAKEA